MDRRWSTEDDCYPADKYEMSFYLASNSAVIASIVTRLSFPAYIFVVGLVSLEMCQFAGRAIHGCVCTYSNSACELCAVTSKIAIPCKSAGACISISGGGGDGPPVETRNETRNDETRSYRRACRGLCLTGFRALLTSIGDARIQVWAARL